MIQLLRSLPRIHRATVLYKAAVEGPMVTTGMQQNSQNTLSRNRSTIFPVTR